MGFISKATTLHVHHAFFFTNFFGVPAQLRRGTACITLFFYKFLWSPCTTTTWNGKAKNFTVSLRLNSKAVDSLQFRPNIPTFK